MQSLERVIAILEVEAGMIQSHAAKLVSTASLLADEERRQFMQLADEETARAETIRQQIRLLRDHLCTDSHEVA